MVVSKNMNHEGTAGRHMSFLAFVCLIVAGAGPASAEQKIYWSDASFPPSIQKSDLDGSNVETVIEQSAPAGGIGGVALDAAAGKVYWTDYKNSAIKRVDRDGANIETLISGLSAPRGIALDLTNSKIYWTDTGTGSIERANLDGTGREVVLAGRNNPYDVALDIASGKFYWVESHFSGAVFRANFDGTVVEELAVGHRFPRSLDLDLTNFHVYWCSGSQACAISRANLDGTDVVNIGAITAVTRFELDADGGKIYWTGSQGFGGVGGNAVRRANLDGTGIEVLASFDSIDSPACGPSPRSPNGLALDIAGGKLVSGVGLNFSAFETSSIEQANLDGTGLETLVAAPEIVLCTPNGIAIDQVASKVYWAEPQRGIGRANLDGTNFEMVNTTTIAKDVAVDPRNGKIYWTHVQAANSHIFKADGDGSNVEQFRPFPNFDKDPRTITLDFVNDKVYWTDPTENTGGAIGAVHRMNLDGSMPETPFVAFKPLSIAVDPAAGKIYFGDNNLSVSTLLRADFDGTNIISLANPNPASPMLSDLAIDVLAGKLYWTTSNRIGSVDLDTLAVEILHDVSTIGIALLLDMDDDSVSDDLDTCTLIPNADQRDSNGDGIGNACDADLDNNCAINFLDLGILKSVFFSNDADADFNGDGAVNFLDLGIMKAAFFGPPGPSGVPNVCNTP